MISGMVKILLPGLIALQATVAMAVPAVSGLVSNRAALGLPVNARLSSCVAPVAVSSTAIAPAGGVAACDNGPGASDLVGPHGQALLLALGGLAAVGIGFAATSGHHHYGSTPLSP